MQVFGRMLVSATAVACAGALYIGAVQAAPVSGRMAVSSQLSPAAMTKMTHKKKHKKHVVKRVHPGGCGTMMYYDKKTGTCANAMFKKTT